MQISRWRFEQLPHSLLQLITVLSKEAIITYYGQQVTACTLE